MKLKIENKVEEIKLVPLEGTDTDKFFLYEGDLYCGIHPYLAKDLCSNSEVKIDYLTAINRVTGEKMRLRGAAINLSNGKITFFKGDEKIQEIDKAKISFK